jgi:hypothetical protein
MVTPHVEGPDPSKRKAQRASAEAAKKEGMDRAERHANEEWKRIMYELIVQVARRRRRLTADDVYDLYYQTGQTADTHEHRALGPVFTNAAKAGVIKKTAFFIKSRRKSKHASPLQIWESLIFGT